jgi:hypothetical protein
LQTFRFKDLHFPTITLHQFLQKVNFCAINPINIPEKIAQKTSKPQKLLYFSDLKQNPYISQFDLPYQWKIIKKPAIMVVYFVSHRIFSITKMRHATLRYSNKKHISDIKGR